MKVLKIVILASVLTIVCGTRYAYFDNNLIGYQEIPTQKISISHSYQEPKIIINEQEQNFENLDIVHNLSPSHVSTLNLETAQNSSASHVSTLNLETAQNSSASHVSTLNLETSQNSSASHVSTSNLETALNASASRVSTLNLDIAQNSDVSTSTNTGDIEEIQPSPSPIGIIYSMVSRFIGFVKMLVMKVVTNVASLIFSFFSIAFSSLSSLSKIYDTNFLPDVTEFSSFVTPERLKRATKFLETKIHRLKSV